MNGKLKDPVLYNDWHALAKAEDLKPGTVVAARLLDVELVLWRGEDTQVLAWDDRCPHRSVRLSSGRVSDNTLICPYHGLVFDREGHCVQVPAHPEYVPPKQACVQTYQVQERYGLIFISLGKPGQEIAPFWEWEDANYLKFLSGPHYCRSSGYRAIENFVDLAHLPFLHPGILGAPGMTSVQDYQVAIDKQGIRLSSIQIWQPDPVGLGQTTIADYTYWIFRPLTAYLQKETPDGQRLTILYCVTPVGEEEFLGWMWVATNFGDASSIDAMRSFQDSIVKQDLVNLERHNPKRLPLNLPAEFHLPCDRGSLAYRKWLKNLQVEFV
jgi:phenylpropionate dioxygenase-like ring-hydroxylating dioxygenase large terminal subunit